MCGAVRYRAVGRPRHVNHCHCAMCRKGSGAPIVTWATFTTATLSFTKGKPATRRSSDIAMRGYCAACGSALTWQGDSNPDLIDITAGTLDRPERVAPVDHLWTEAAVPWLDVRDTLPRYRRSRSAG
ncbi:MAG: GFA family protein [Rhodospirillales bacterium]|nr:GFA family protein [Rhodospirillales bacterium]